MNSKYISKEIWGLDFIEYYFFSSIFYKRCPGQKDVTQNSWDILTLPMHRLFSSKAQGYKAFRKPSRPCRIGIHWIALARYSQMSTHVPGFSVISLGFLHHFGLAKLATSSIWVKELIKA